MKKYIHTTFLSLILGLNLLPGSINGNHLDATLSSPELRKKFTPFLNTILKQLPSDRFFELTDTIKQRYNPQSNTEWYAHLQESINQIRPTFPTYHALKALSNQKNQLKIQIQQHIPKDTKIDGYLEIGTPGTYISTIQKSMQLSGKKYVIHDKKRITDCIQTQKYQAYDSFIHLNNYDPITTKDIPDNSIDLVTCFIGLHHAPPEKVDAFINSINRILRPGGRFILREHNCDSPTNTTMAYAAHSIFNIATSETLEAEQTEVRNFQPLSYWTKKLSLQNFTPLPLQTEQPLDPTANKMICSIKKIASSDDKEIAFSHTLKKEMAYERAHINGYLTAPEWLSVDLSQQEAHYAQEKMFYEFSYFKSTALLWKLFKKSWDQARAEASFSQVALSEYTLMNLFICSSTSIKYLLKGVATTPIRLIKPKEKTELMRTTAAISQEYGEWINHTPFYDFNYFSNINRVWKTVFDSLKKKRNTEGNKAALKAICTTWDIPLAVSSTAEYLADGIIAKIVQKTCSSTEPEKIMMIVKDPRKKITRLHNGIEIKAVNQDQTLTAVAVPRYKEFLLIMQKLAENPDINLIEIAGQKSIQLKVRYQKNGNINFDSYKKEYEWQLPSDESNVYATIMVEVPKLIATLKDLKTKNIEVVYLHDY